jgi:hypothetical protein
MTKRKPTTDSLAVLSAKVEGVSDRVDLMHSDIKELRARNETLLAHLLKPSVWERSVVGIGAFVLANWKIIAIVVVTALGGSPAILSLLNQ